jgi:chromosome segregation ATPase
MPYLDLYTTTGTLLGLLVGSILGYWLARLVFNHTADRLERKVLSLSDNKFKLKGQRVQLKQLEQRLDAEAAAIPLAEQELHDKTVEIQELTTALTETTALAADLTQALRTRKAKLEHLEVENSRWKTRNKALKFKTKQLDEEITVLSVAVEEGRSVNSQIEIEQSNQSSKKDKLRAELNAHARQITGHNDTKSTKGVSKGTKAEAASSIAADAPLEATPEMTPELTKEANAEALTNEAPWYATDLPSDTHNNLNQLSSRLERMETELGAWLDKVGKLEQQVPRQDDQKSSLTLLEQVLRGEASKHTKAFGNGAASNADCVDKRNNGTG